MTNDELRGTLESAGRAPVEPILDPPEGYESLAGLFFMRRMSGGARDSWNHWVWVHSRQTKSKTGEDILLPSESATHYTARLVARSLCNAEGALLYDYANGADVAALSELDDPVLRWFDDAIRPFNGIGKEAEEAAEKNSESGPSLPIGTGSPAASG